MKKKAKRVRIDRNYFVADPRFWALLKDGYEASVESVPEIGDTELHICLQKPKRRGVWVNLIGGYVRRIELLLGKPERARVDMVFGPRELEIVLYDRWRQAFDGQPHGMAQVHVVDTENGYGGRLVVYLDYHCDNPNVVFITIAGESKQASCRQGRINVSVLRKMVSERKAPMNGIGCVVLQVTPPNGEHAETWVLPVGVLPRHVLSVASELMRFVESAISKPPSQNNKHGGRNTSPNVLERNAF